MWKAIRISVLLVVLVVVAAATCPRFPQQYAEIMAGQRAISDHEQETPESLQDVLVGPQTAREIGWTRK